MLFIMVIFLLSDVIYFFYGILLYNLVFQKKWLTLSNPQCLDQWKKLGEYINKKFSNKNDDNNTNNNNNNNLNII